MDFPPDSPHSKSSSSRWSAVFVFVFANAIRGDGDRIAGLKVDVIAIDLIDQTSAGISIATLLVMKVAAFGLERLNDLLEARCTAIGVPDRYGFRQFVLEAEALYIPDREKQKCKHNCKAAH